MAKKNTPIIEFENLPKEIIEWVVPRLSPNEKVNLCIHYTYEYLRNDIRAVTYLVTSQKFMEIYTRVRKENGTHTYYRHNTYFLSDIREINDDNESHPEEDKITFRFYHDYKEISLDPIAGQRILEIIYPLLWKIKPHG